MRRRLTILALVLGMVGALLATAGVATGDPGVPVVVDAGVLRLHLGDTDNLPDQDYFRFDAPDGFGGYSIGVPQVITPGKKCDDYTLVGPAWAALSAASGKWGFVDDGIGVRISGPQGTRCGQFDNGEVLIFELGSELDGKMIDYAELDIEIKFDATVVVSAFDTTSAAPGIPVFTQSVICNPSDCGPDSADGDNYRVLVSAVDSLGDLIEFDRLEFRVTSLGNNQAASLEGGADGTGFLTGGLGQSLNTIDSLFHLVEEFDGTLDCGDGFTIGDGITDAQLTVLRGGQVNCIEKLYRAEVLGSTASFFPFGPATDPPTEELADFTALITWPAEPRGDVGDIAVTQIDFDGPGVGDPAEPVQWCLGDPARVNDLDPTTVDPLSIDTSDPDQPFLVPPDLPLDTPWCLLDQVVSYIGGAEIQVTEYYYGVEIDPFLQR